MEQQTHQYVTYPEEGELSPIVYSTDPIDYSLFESSEEKVEQVRKQLDQVKLLLRVKKTANIKELGEEMHPKITGGTERNLLSKLMAQDKRFKRISSHAWVLNKEETPKPRIIPDRATTRVADYIEIPPDPKTGKVWKRREVKTEIRAIRAEENILAE